MAIEYKEGWYRGAVTQTALGKNEKTGTPEFVIQAQVLSQGGIQCDMQYKRTMRLWLSEKALPHSVDKLIGLGFQGSSIDDLMAHNFVGVECDMNCKYEKNAETGEAYEKWELGWGAKPVETAEMNASELRGLNALFGAALRSKGAAKPKAKQTTPPERDAADPGYSASDFI